MISIHYKTCSNCHKIIKVDEVCECRKEKRQEYKKEYNKQYEEDNPEAVKPIKTMQWRRLRKNIITRDGGYCQRCKNLLGIINSVNLEVHHIKPRSQYPELIFDPTNLITVCSNCNKALGTSGELDFEPDVDLEGRDYRVY